MEKTNQNTDLKVGDENPVNRTSTLELNIDEPNKRLLNKLGDLSGVDINNDRFNWFLESALNKEISRLEKTN